MVLSAGKLKMGQGMEYKINDIFFWVDIGLCSNLFLYLVGNRLPEGWRGRSKRPPIISYVREQDDKSVHY